MSTPDLAGARWVKSSYSGGNGTCVETAALADGRVAVRNSNHPDDGVTVFTRAEMDAWIKGVKDGEFDQFT